MDMGPPIVQIVQFEGQTVRIGVTSTTECYLRRASLTLGRETQYRVICSYDFDRLLRPAVQVCSTGSDPSRC